MSRSILCLCVLLAACGTGPAAAPPSTSGPVSTMTSTSTTTTTSTTTSTSTSTTTVPTTAAPTTLPTTTIPWAPPPAPTSPPIPPTTTPPPPPAPRAVVEQDWIPFGTAGGVTLHHPSRRVEQIGFHQSNDEGARAIQAFATGVPATTMETRDRLSDPNSAADIVIDPASDIRSPVSGTVLSTGSYDLYCGLFDYFINIEPDERPGWRVRIIHLGGVNVAVGDRVQAGVTVIAPSTRQLPFASQVDDLRVAAPPWPHVHVEVSDPSIPNVPNTGSGYENC